ncbi:D-alanyl-D-alanine carboxypeptidase family protein [Kitasatospora cineracea]|uniref:D-alanyl-D-alanine carboxypeptidase (Penicillin-binding protein 5/6) n=1 Tax=Kitasatospora cineracea TaxID=88074 RepID=A0A8G1UEK7_9ACTN|nr:D-alanyl-D-alanine carboxypeptidase [Kitasatospora cineracea]ROR42548.1 D-alanyl-D-alanine carboxypeptidase (penicillin-binding protein 5/6) [Kitasatospora cineracea]
MSVHQKSELEVGAGRGRVSRRGVVGVVGALLAVGVGGGVVSVLPGGGPGPEAVGRGGVVPGLRLSDAAAGLDLPWPVEGQTAVAVAGAGVLGLRGAQQPVPIASVTKVMTARVVLRDHPLAEGEDGPMIAVDEQAAAEAASPGESTAPVRAGQRLSLRKLLEVMLLPSANNVARLLARWDAGSQEAFVARMNAEAARLGMTGTTYTGASGVEESTVSTAVDQLVLAREAMKDPVLRATVALRSTTLPGRDEPLRNTNTLLGRPGVVGLKTGSGTAAGGNLMWAMEVPDGKGGQGRRLVYGVVLGQHARTTPAEGLRAVLESSGQFVEALQQKLPGVLAALASEQREWA